MLIYIIEVILWTLILYPIFEKIRKIIFYEIIIPNNTYNKTKSESKNTKQPLGNKELF